MGEADGVQDVGRLFAGHCVQVSVDLETNRQTGGSTSPADSWIAVGMKR